jgi:hypothetical protein
MRKVLAIVTILITSIAIQGQEKSDWWDTKWQFRREVKIKNNLVDELPRGFPTKVKLDLHWLDMADKTKHDLSDLRVVYNGKEIPFIISSVTKMETTIYIKTQEKISGGSKGEGYFLYYGNKDANPPKYKKQDVFALFENFGEKNLAEVLIPDKDLKYSCEKGMLEIKEIPISGSEELAPKITFNSKDMPDSFKFDVDLTIGFPEIINTGGIFKVLVNLEFVDDVDPKLEKEIDDLIKKLGADEWKTREEATNKLIEVGRPAIRKLEIAKNDTDAEVRWRTSYVLEEIIKKCGAERISLGVTGEGMWNFLGRYACIGVKMINEKPLYKEVQNTDVSLSITRDKDGDMELFIDKRSVLNGVRKEKISRVYISFYKAQEDFPRVTIRSVMLTPYVEPEPSIEIGIEGKSK